MANALTNEEIKRIREVSIATIIGERDSGRRVSIRCPFHNERTASFVLYPNNTFHCFGCGANGQGAIDFCVALGYTFVEACNELIQYI